MNGIVAQTRKELAQCAVALKVAGGNSELLEECVIQRSWLWLNEHVNCLYAQYLVTTP